MSTVLQQFLPFVNSNFSLRPGQIGTVDDSGNYYYTYPLNDGIRTLNCRFALPRSTVSLNGNKLLSVALIYQIISPTALASATISLTKYTFTDGDAYPGSVIPISITSDPFVLAPSSTLNVTQSTIDTPEFDNETSGTSVCYNYTVVLEQLTESLGLYVYGLQLIYAQDTQPAVSSSTTVTSADSPYAADPANSGMTIPVDTSGGGVTITLPLIVANPSDPTYTGCTITVKNLITSANPLAIVPDGGNCIKGLGLNPAGTVGKYYIDLAPQAGDFISIISDGNQGWTVTSASGVWAREA